MPKLGGWNIDNLRGTPLPQKAQTAFTTFTQNLVGAEYTPLLFVGTQAVNGTNYCFIALQTIICSQPLKRLVKIILNEKSDGKVEAVSIERIMKF